ncbi:MAG: ABC transporter ATP-binding protein [Eubacteriales bacterium]|nr:ABC transporter ATP-binding protein [Eubacteriales bacterium]
MSSIELKNISMTYDKGVKALKNVDLQVNDHEFLVLLGPSGCGKSTLLRIVAGLITETEGDILFDGESMKGKDARERNISMVFQNYALYPHLNVFKNIAFPLGNIKGITKEEIKERVEETARLLDIEEILNRRPRELSGGQKQRVALGRAIVRDPRVFLFDEPLSNLDVKMRGDLRDLIAEIHRNLNTTFIYVTHDQSEAMVLGDRVAVMENGVIKQVGAPQDVYNNPNCVYVAGFVGSPKMNFFASRITKGEGSYSVKIMGNMFDIPVERLPLDTELKDDRVISGIRPEDFKLERPEKPYGSLRATVTKCIPMGSGLHVELSCNDKSFLAVFLNHTDVKVGEEIELFVETDVIHLFDPETEEAICRRIR